MSKSVAIMFTLTAIAMTLDIVFAQSTASIIIHDCHKASAQLVKDSLKFTFTSIILATV